MAATAAGPADGRLLQEHPKRLTGKKRKAPAEELPPELRCSLWQQRKGRFCPQPRIPDSEFCTHHRADGPHKRRRSETIQRHLCALCGMRHSRSEASHRQRCPVWKRMEAVRALPWFRENVNVLHPSDQSPRESAQAIQEQDEDEAKQDGDEHRPTLSDDKEPLLYQGRAEWQRTFDRLHALAIGLGLDPEQASAPAGPAQPPPDAATRRLLEAYLEAEAGARNSLKNETQLAGLFSVLVRSGLLTEAAAVAGGGEASEDWRRDVDCLLEMGAGRCGMSSAIANLLLQREHPEADLLAPDALAAAPEPKVSDSHLRLFRQTADSPSAPADGRFPELSVVAVDRAHFHDLKKVHCRRTLVRTDIRHLWLAGLPELRGRRVCVLSKHLCGAATDLSLRALQQLSPDAAEIRPRGLLIALCCHHRCSWDSYVGRERLERLGVDERLFTVLCRMSAWAVLPDEEDLDRLRILRQQQQKDQEQKQEEPEASEVLSGRAFLEGSLSRMQATGRLCKRVLDRGRELWMQTALGCQRLARETYCDPGISPENQVLWARFPES